MKVPTSHAASPSRADTAMTPMIDVVFLLLIFFVWTASFQAIEAILPSQLTSVVSPGAGADQLREDFERVVVRIHLVETQVRWEMNQQRVTSLDALGEQLGRLSAIKSDLPVVVDPDEGVPFGDVIDVYDIALRAGLSNIQLTTREALLRR